MHGGDFPSKCLEGPRTLGKEGGEKMGLWKLIKKLFLEKDISWGKIVKSSIIKNHQKSIRVS